MRIAFLLFLAGLDTVAAAPSFSFRHLAQAPDDRRAISSGTVASAQAVEEQLRRHTFVNLTRIVARDAQFAGVELKNGDPVVLSLPLASRDTDECDHAADVDLERESANFAFSLGPHRCLGSHPARLGMQLALDEWHARIPDYGLAGDVGSYAGTVMGVTRCRCAGDGPGWREISAPTRRRTVPPDDDRGVEDEVPAGQTLLALYDRALPQVYGYLFDRCRDVATAEDLTSETFLAAAAAAEGRSGALVSIPWMIGIARHKLVDHWRRRSRDERLATAIAGGTVEHGDPWDVHLDGVHATDVLGRLGGHHRAALTLRYVDDLPVPQVAELLGRTVHATEALLVRARAAYRKAYESEGGDA